MPGLPILDLNTQLYIGVPVVSILLWVAKLLWQVTTVQREMHTHLYGRDGIPGILQDLDERVGTLESVREGSGSYKSHYFRHRDKETPK